MPEIEKIGFLQTSIFEEYDELLDLLFFDFLDLNKFLNILSALLLPSKTSLSSALNAFVANNLNNLVVINIEVSIVAILLKTWMKH